MNAAVTPTYSSFWNEYVVHVDYNEIDISDSTEEKNTKYSSLGDEKVEIYYKAKVNAKNGKIKSV